MRRTFSLGLLFFVSLSATGCDLPYYWQAARGQIALLGARRPLEGIFGDREAPRAVVSKLRVAYDARFYAVIELGLPEAGQFTTYADLKRPQVSWLVVACAPYQFEPYVFHYPLIGSQTYRGYFERNDAETLTAELQEQGYDTAIRPVTAYSTLGWFADPILNTMIQGRVTDLIGLIFHESAHLVVYVEDDTAFNEGFATFVENEGLRQYLAAKLPKLLDEYRQSQADRKRFRQIVLRGRQRLVDLYAQPGLPLEVKQQRKAALFQQMRDDYAAAKDQFQLLSYDAWFEREDLNNAHLVAFAQYRSLEGAFAELFAQHEGHWKAFYEAVEALADVPREERHQKLAQLIRQGEERTARAASEASSSDDADPKPEAKTPPQS